MKQQEEELFDHEEDYFDDDQDQIKGEKKRNFKLLLPLILLMGVLLLFGGYYYYLKLSGSLVTNTPVATIPEPTDSTIVGADNLDQVALADAQLVKQEKDATMPKSEPKAEEVTRVDFSVKSKKQEPAVKNEPILETPKRPILNQPSDKGIVSPKLNTTHQKRSKTKKTDFVVTTKSNPNSLNEDPFNIVVGQKKAGQNSSKNENTKTTSGNNYNEYLRQYSSSAQDEEPVPGTINGKQKIVPGQTIGIRTQKDFIIKGQTIKAGSVIYGLPIIDNGRVAIKINNIKNGNSLVRTNIQVLGEDMNEGVQYILKGTTDYSGTKGQVIDAATSQMGVIGSLIGSVGRTTNKAREPEYWLPDGKKVYLSIN
ncbi:conjugative transposon protein TraM [Pedobacter nutrimenti]|uniref:Uncharacterized protein DUF3714 n=1 Tax=Pedobacter nutrimenti TaxID=1241337 RepID=A0A318UAF6_9SPHI|nr:conjugative transposon protein TraM [Pedobacter nutrimenti]PYF68437.1 uncharacterized protein DUF3714 [Pedobacter nutrimenti]